jgi:hypothetical protein
MSLPREPCISRPRLPAFDGFHDALRPTPRGFERVDINLALAALEKDASVAIRWDSNDYALAELRVPDALAGGYCGEGGLIYRRHQEIRWR